MGYGDFVGAYKPVPHYIGTSTKTYSSDGSLIENGHPLYEKLPIVRYDYRPGPFISAYMRAKKKPSEVVVILIEEINRANPAQVFGDLIQLLDRKEDGSSEYPITPSPDLAAFLVEQGVHKPSDVLSIPPNLYIWATMNRADESVNYIDSAFLRRWSIEYLPYDLDCKYDSEIIKVHGTDVMWKDFRAAVNTFLAEELEGIEDDKFIGPYFLKKDELIDPLKVFSKLVMYLWHDVVPMDRKKVFVGNSLAILFRAWMDGEKVFRFDIAS